MFAGFIKLKVFQIIFLLVLVAFLSACPQTPPPPQNFTEAKIILQNYIWHDQRKTIYCGAQYDENKKITLPEGFQTKVHLSRSTRMEWEHAVPAENFGRAFAAWREGDSACVRDGKPYKGRRCAEKTSRTFRKMEADMYNLFPSIGAVNAARGNRQYAELPDEPSQFGSCSAKAAGNRFEPPDRAKGVVARAALYMERQYKEYKLANQQKRLFNAWNNMFPPDGEECERARRIAKIQGNENQVVKEACGKMGYG